MGTGGRGGGGGSTTSDLTPAAVDGDNAAEAKRRASSAGVRNKSRRARTKTACGTLAQYSSWAAGCLAHVLAHVSSVV